LSDKVLKKNIQDGGLLIAFRQNISKSSKTKQDMKVTEFSIPSTNKCADNLQVIFLTLENLIEKWCSDKMSLFNVRNARR
jgi:hypothetical protein